MFDESYVNIIGSMNVDQIATAFLTMKGIFTSSRYYNYDGLSDNAVVYKNGNERDVYIFPYTIAEFLKIISIMASNSTKLKKPFFSSKKKEPGWVANKYIDRGQDDHD